MFSPAHISRAQSLTLSAGAACVLTDASVPPQRLNHMTRQAPHLTLPAPGPASPCGPGRGSYCSRRADASQPSRALHYMGPTPERACSRRYLYARRELRSFCSSVAMGAVRGALEGTRDGAADSYCLEVPLCPDQAPVGHRYADELVRLEVPHEDVTQWAGRAAGHVLQGSQAARRSAVTGDIAGSNPAPAALLRGSQTVRLSILNRGIAGSTPARATTPAAA